MQPNQHTITVFEHDILSLNAQNKWLLNKKEIPHLQNEAENKKTLASLVTFFGEKGVPYYTLTRNGAKFCKYVGVLQLGNTTIEILPKADKQATENEWRSTLIGMLRAAGYFQFNAPTNSALNLKPNAILHLYFELFLEKVEYLLHQGLVKKYRKTEGNSPSLKGSLHFSKHLQQNYLHEERFYVKYTTYDYEHQLHFLLYKTLRLLHHVNTNANLQSRIGALLLNFPEMPDIKVTETTFNKLIFNRKTEDYRPAIEIARLLLLNYHPDLSKGKQDVLALLFDMNLLWEKFVYASLRKQFAKEDPDIQVFEQKNKKFWEGEGSNVKIKPDIIIHQKSTDLTFVLDTKWKNLKDYKPSPEDLRQLYVYHDYWKARKVTLVYPAANDAYLKGHFYGENENLTNKECSVILISPQNSISEWQKTIYMRLNDWIKST